MQRVVLLLAVLTCGGCGRDDANGAAPVHDASNTTVTTIRDENPYCLPSEMAENTNSTPLVYMSGVIEAPCKCRAGSGRPGLSAARVSVILRAMQNAGLCTTGECTTSTHCICEIPRAGGDSLNACMNEADPVPSGKNGWCYLQPSAGLGNADIISSCSGDDSQAIRMIGTAMPLERETFFLAVEADI